MSSHQSKYFIARNQFSYNTVTTANVLCIHNLSLKFRRPAQRIVTSHDYVKMTAKLALIIFRGLVIFLN